MSSKLSKKEIASRTSRRCACWWSTTISTCARWSAISWSIAASRTSTRPPTESPRSTPSAPSAPDVVILDWEMPLLSGAELVRIVRSPGVFPMPDVPIIMLSGHGERWRVVEAMRLGVNEYLIKPVSAKALYDRLVSITAQPRPMVQLGDYYGPEPRKHAGECVEDVDRVLAVRSDSADLTRPVARRATSARRSFGGPQRSALRKPAKIHAGRIGVNADLPARSEVLRPGPIRMPRPLLRIEALTKRFGGVAVGRSPVARHLSGRVLRAARAFGLRQDHAAAADRGLRAAERRPHPARRRRSRARCRRYRRPVNMMFQSYALFPHLNGRGQYRVRPQAGGPAAGARSHERVADMLALVKLEELRRAQAARAVRRPAPARGAGALAGQAPARAAARRADGGARQEAARRDAVRADGAAAQRSG